jgi:beta-lactamase class D
MQNYLAAFHYGNQAMTTELVAPGKENPAWFHSGPLRISPREQVGFIRKMLQYELGISSDAIDSTKLILFREELATGWKLFGKTGLRVIGRNDNNDLEYGWFVGWIENKDRYFPFAYLILDEKIRLGKRVPRVIELVNESGIISQ